MSHLLFRRVLGVLVGLLCSPLLLLLWLACLPWDLWMRATGRMAPWQARQRQREAEERALAHQMHAMATAWDDLADAIRHPQKPRIRVYPAVHRV